MNAEQLKLFTDDELPRLTETEEALVHFMRKCMQLETEINDLKYEIGVLKNEVTH